MPFTHVEIERQKTRTITWLFLLLVLLYAVSLAMLIGGIRIAGALFTASGREAGLAPTAADLIGIFACSLGFGALHWCYSTRQLFDRLLAGVGASPVDSRDAYHTVLSNVISEVSIATGGRPIEPYVIPTTAINACAVLDFNGRAAIAVTEGALAQFTRAQLESVVGHEAAHIVSGDSLTASVFCSLFALHEETLKQLGGLLDPDGDSWPGPILAETILPVFAVAVLWVVQQMKQACEVAISWEREYRADAVAVRLTRNPLSLAEALGIMSRRWRGVGGRGESFGSIFLMDPGLSAWSEQGGVIAELFSSHPPTEERIRLLLGMAHVDPARFGEEIEALLAHKRPRTPPAPLRPAVTQEVPLQWMIWQQDVWSGPFALSELAQRSDLLPESWVQRMGSASTQPAYWDAQLLEMFRARYAGLTEAGARASTECPNCRIGLTTVLYEGASIDRCPACQGCYVDPQMLTKVFAREEYQFSDGVKRMGDLLLSLRGHRQAGARRRALPRQPLHRPCPRCGAAVVRKFYTEAYRVEVEQCWECGLTWLDRDELELLQYLYEHRRDLDDFFNEDTTRPPSIKE